MSFGQRGISPIGAVIAWLKSLAGTPALAAQGRDEWVEVNGQTINDVQSPYNGVTIPDLIGTTDSSRKFLRGSTTSGAFTSNATHSHCICGCAICSGCGYYQGLCFYNVNTDSQSHIPPSYTVVWILRSK